MVGIARISRMENVELRILCSIATIFNFFWDEGDDFVCEDEERTAFE